MRRRGDIKLTTSELRRRGSTAGRGPGSWRLRMLVLAAAVAALILSGMPGPRNVEALPPQFENTLVATVSGGAMDVEWTPDGRMLIITKSGRVRVYENGTLISTPALDLGAVMCTNGERGLAGIDVHPNFASNRWVYLYYTYNKFGTCNESEVDGPVNRLSRFVLSDNNVIDPASEVVLFDTPPMFRDHHTGGDVEFGKDGYLYVTVGDGGSARFGWPQDPGRLLGKIVRLTDSGGIPADNPFTGPGTARCNVDGVPPPGSPAGTKCQEIFSQGLRNPFRFAHDPNAAGVRFYVNDVGQHSWEDISEGPVAGGDYGWPVREGPCAKDSTTDCGPAPAGMLDPVHWYGHGPFGAAATAGAFVPNGVWPSSYDGVYLFADYVFGQMYELRPGGTRCLTCSPPASGWDQAVFGDILEVVSMRFGPHEGGQALYYVTRDGNEVRRIAFVGDENRSPTAHVDAQPTSGPLPLEVTFDGSGSSDPDGDTLTYEWDFDGDGTPDSTDALATHTYDAEGIYFATLTVRDGNGGENTATIRIDAGNEAPEPVIHTPAPGTTFAVGETFILSGSATDPEDGTLPDTTLTWEVIRHHDTHFHPFLEPVSGNNLQIVAPEPEDFDAARTSYLEVFLTATDSNGLSKTVSLELHPRKVNVTFETAPLGLRITVNDASVEGPTTAESWEGYELRVNAPDQFDTSGAFWEFDSWSDGGAGSHTIVTPATPATFTASFTEGDAPPPEPITLTPVADAYVSSVEPSRNFGGASSIRTDNSPVINSYLKFEVSGVTAPVTSAVLRIYPSTGNSIGYDVRGVADNSWTEGGITHSNAPSFGSVAGSSGRVTAGTWTEVDVTSLVTGNGTLTLAMTSTSNTATSFHSREGANPPQLIVTMAGTQEDDTEPPSVPEGLSANAVSPSEIQLSWGASTDNVGVSGYTIYRDGAVLATVDSSTLAHSDLTVEAETTYTYEVEAFDAAGNVARSAPAIVTTPAEGGGATMTFVAAADSYVSASEPGRNFGGATSIRTDGSPVINSYLRFDVSGLPGPVTSAVLRVYPSSSNSIGYDVHEVSTNDWTESGITFSNAPALGAAVGSSGLVRAGAWTEVDVTDVVTANGAVSFAMTSASSTATSFNSREGTNKPELVIVTGDGGGDTTPPSPPANLSAVAMSPTEVELSWHASSDNVAVAGYTIYRDGVELATVGASTLSYDDATAEPETTYQYEVEAADASGNRARSDPAVVTTPPASGGSDLTFNPVADSYVSSAEPNRNFGSSSSIRTDGSPEINSYLQFDVSGLPGPVTRAVLRVYPSSSNSIGYDVHGVSTNTWTESAITFSNAPALGTIVGSSGRVIAGSWTEVDVTDLVAGNGTFSFAMSSTSSTATSFNSSEGANPPELVITTASSVASISGSDGAPGSTAAVTRLADQQLGEGLPPAPATTAALLPSTESRTRAGPMRADPA